MDKAVSRRRLRHELLRACSRSRTASDGAGGRAFWREGKTAIEIAGNHERISIPNEPKSRIGT